jgi:hypothetical protein
MILSPIVWFTQLLDVPSLKKLLMMLLQKMLKLPSFTIVPIQFPSQLAKCMVTIIGK